MKLLLLSNSRNPDGEYLQHALDAFEKIGQKTKRAVFIPYAGVTISFDEYLANVQHALRSTGISVQSVHLTTDPVALINDAELILGGGGNTFRLLQLCRRDGLLAAIRSKVTRGTPYVGWSAGTNLACPSIRTTNDMPIVDPKGLDALNFVPFQINPHYHNDLPPGHQGETRAQRIAEFTRVNPEIPVLGLREGSWLEIDGTRATLYGPKTAPLFKEGSVVKELNPGDVSFLLGS